MKDIIKGLLLTILAGACAGASVGIGYVAGCKAGEALANKLIEIKNTSNKKKEEEEVNKMVLDELNKVTGKNY